MLNATSERTTRIMRRNEQPMANAYRPRKIKYRPGTTIPGHQDIDGLTLPMTPLYVCGENMPFPGETMWGIQREWQQKCMIFSVLEGDLEPLL